MLKYHSYNIVFQEVPNEITLAINIANCPNKCRGCHSPWLQNDIGEPLTKQVIDSLVNGYGTGVTCICFMGGDDAPEQVNYLAEYIKIVTDNRMKTAWYSGKPKFSEFGSLTNFDYIKLGPYIEVCGGLDSSDTNQRFYQIVDKQLVDKTCLFQRKKPVLQSSAASLGETV
nr:anaerobic ribonucleoside-triphosphate reductase activating protein [uncultured Carboxylicivirga sp.]